MISVNAFVCRQCGEERYQKVLFIGLEFAFQCPCCEAIHLFYENIHYDINDHFNNAPWSRYIGYWYQRKLFSHSAIKEEIVEKFKRLIEGRHNHDEDQIIKHRLSNKVPNGKFFVTSMLHDHFQEAFRALYHMKGHLSSKYNDTYNVLIVPKTDLFSWLLQEPLKIKGIDEVWEVPFARCHRWPFANKDEDVKASWEVCNEVQKALDKLEGIGTVINKRAGAIPNGKQIIKELLEPLNPKPLRDSRGDYLKGTYVGVLFKSETAERAGLWKASHFQEISVIVKDIDLKPLLIIVTQSDLDRVKQLDQPIPYLFAPTVLQQAQVFRNNIHFVIGTNCSGCNLPALYDLPMYVFAKGRTYPDDFYCFSRMASKFDKKQPWNGAFEKADNIHEEAIPLEKPLQIILYRERIQNWIIKHRKNASYERQGRIRLLEGYIEKCPKCGTLRKSHERVLVRSDIVYICNCNCGIGKFIAYYGLTTSSLVGIYGINEDCEEVNRFRQALELRGQTSKSICFKKHLNDKTNDKQDPIYFYSMKPSLGDFYYTLPCLISLREDFPKRKIVVVTHNEYVSLLPMAFLDEYWALEAPSPYDFSKNIYSEAHKFLEKEIGNAPIVSNYPGILPADKNSYYRLRQGSNDGTGKTAVTICCRLQSNRKWPNCEFLVRLLSVFEREQLSYKVLVFPANEKVELPKEWSQISNLIVNPSISYQIELALDTRVWLAPHGAAGVIASITNTPVVELETIPPWWKHPEPQPIRFGLPFQKFRKLEGKTYSDIPLDKILEAIRELL